MEFNKRIVDSYPELFTQGSDKEPSGFGSKWGSFSEVYTLAKGDITRFDEITKLSLHLCLTYLAFETDKAQEEKRLIDKSMKR